MGPRPYSEKSSLPTEAEDPLTEIPTQIIPDSPSPSTLSGTTTPSPTPQEFIPVEPYVEGVNVQNNEIPGRVAPIPSVPSSWNDVPYDDSFLDFIRQVTNQPNLANLQSLRLRVNSFHMSIHRMGTHMPNLTELNLEGSFLYSLRDFGCSLKNLQILKVGSCQLEFLDGTFGFPSLKELYAQDNYITDITPCSNLPHIRHIDVSGNKIRNISYAGFLSICPKLRSIVFIGNPAAEIEGYRKHVRRILPQIEKLDGIPFLNEEDNAEECKPSDLIENCDEGSDSSSTGVPDCVSVSPSESMNNFFEEEDVFLLDKKNKHARNVANQDYLIDREEFLPELKTKLRDNFSENLNLNKAKAKGILEQTKIMENRNAKQKCIQKLDKDIENRSKKSNLMMMSELKCFEERPSTSGVRKKSSGGKEQKGGKMEMRTIVDDCSIEGRDSGGVRKRPSTAIPKLTKDGIVAEGWNACKLTSGLPICGNLTAALRSRKKAQNAWVDEPFPEWKNIRQERNNSAQLASLINTKNAHQTIVFGREFKARSLDLTNREGGKHVQVQLKGSGDNVDVDEGVENEDELIGEDVLASSKKWREAFRRFRSNNRSRWEEEDDSDYSHLLGETLQVCENELRESTPTDD